MKVSIEAGTAVIAQGKLAVITAIEGEDSVKVRISETGQLCVITVAELEIIPDDHATMSTMARMGTYDPANPSEAARLISAAERSVVIKEYLAGSLSVAEAMFKLSLKKSAFYKLTSRFNHRLGALSIVKSSPGPKQGSQRIPPEVTTIIKECFDEHYHGASATYSHVWKQVQAHCFVKGVPSPGLSTVQRFIKALDPKSVFFKKNGADATNQQFQPRPGHIHTNHPLHHAQMDHTRVDLILCDEHNRTLTIGRPWVTLLIDVHTRVILGFYLSMFSPNLVSVQQTLGMAALPKDKDSIHSPTFGINYPYYGMPQFVGMDNAAEFRSPILEAALELHGSKPLWRKVYKKHMGGVIESLIGTLMTTAVHFLPGSTFSNIKDRGEYDSEAKAAMTFKEFSSWFAGQILIYHGTVHSGIRTSPKDAWNEFFSRKSGTLPPVAINKRILYLDFLPEKHKPVRNNGITINGGIYYSPQLNAYQGREKVVVKFDPRDMTKIWVKLEENYVLTPLSRSSHEYLNFEYYRIHRLFNQRTPPGTVTDPEALLQIMENNKLVSRAKRDTKKSKQSAKQSTAKALHRAHTSNGLPKNVPPMLTYQSSAQLETEQVDFSQPPVLFDIKD